MTSHVTTTGAVLISPVRAERDIGHERVGTAWTATTPRRLPRARVVKGCKTRYLGFLEGLPARGHPGTDRGEHSWLQWPARYTGIHYVVTVIIPSIALMAPLDDGTAPRQAPRVPRTSSTAPSTPSQYIPSYSGPITPPGHLCLAETHLTKTALTRRLPSRAGETSRPDSRRCLRRRRPRAPRRSPAAHTEEPAATFLSASIPRYPSCQVSVVTGTRARPHPATGGPPLTGGAPAGGRTAGVSSTPVASSGRESN